MPLLLNRWLSFPGVRLKQKSNRHSVTITDALVDVVRRSEVFCNVPSTTVRKLLESARVVRVSRGDAVVRQGVPTHSMTIMIEGKAEVCCRREGLQGQLSMAVLSTPSSFCEEALLDPLQPSYSVNMLEDGFVLKIKRQDFSHFIVSGFNHWVEGDTILDDRFTDGSIIWVGSSKQCPESIRSNQPTVMPSVTRIREILSELDCQKLYLCCAKDATVAALAAWLLESCGHQAYAVRQSRRLQIHQQASLS